MTVRSKTPCYVFYAEPRRRKKTDFVLKKLTTLFLYKIDSHIRWKAASYHNFQKNHEKKKSMSVIISYLAFPIYKNKTKTWFSQSIKCLTSVLTKMQSGGEGGNIMQCNISDPCAQKNCQLWIFLISTFWSNLWYCPSFPLYPKT